MLKKIGALLLLCLLHSATVFADTQALSTRAESGSDPTISMLQVAGSSRQMHTMSFQPYVNGISNKNFPLVHVKINDTISGTFILDTGASFSVVSDELVQKLKLKRQPLISQGKTVLLEGKPLDGVVLDTVGVGGFNFAKYMFGVLKSRRIALPTYQIDGILGVDLLQNFEYAFDFSQHQITMLAPARLVTPTDGSPQKYMSDGLTQEEISALGFSQAKSAQLGKSEQDGRIYLHVQFTNNGKTAYEDLILDTGAGSTIILPSLAQQLDLRPISTNVQSTGFPGVEYISTAPLDKFQVGDLILSNQLVDYSSQRDYDKNLPPAFGMDILSKYQVLMDFPNQKVYFKSPTSIKPPLTITIKPH